jgi:hypothetical protein
MLAFAFRRWRFGFRGFAEIQSRRADAGVQASIIKIVSQQLLSEAQPGRITSRPSASSSGSGGGRAKSPPGDRAAHDERVISKRMTWRGRDVFRRKCIPAYLLGSRMVKCATSWRLLAISSGMNARRPSVVRLPAGHARAETADEVGFVDCVVGAKVVN